MNKTELIEIMQEEYHDTLELKKQVFALNYENQKYKREINNLHKALARKDKKIAQLEKELGYAD